MPEIKWECVLDKIIREITNGSKVAGEQVIAKDYNLATKSMAKVFKKLSDSNIAKQSPVNNRYYLTDECYENAQQLYFSMILDNINEIKMLAESVNISTDVLIDVFAETIKGDVNV